MSPRFFGNSKRPLFGIFHPARGGRNSSNNVVLCPPIGHEYVRTHWAMRSLASKLAREGVNVFRFDYRGTGDSSLDISDIDTLEDWASDTREAATELLETSSSDENNLVLVGLRMGGTIAALAANDLASEEGIKPRVVLWEPTPSGSSYVEEIREMHHRMVDLWSSKIETEDSSTHEELLGFRFRKSLIAEITQCDLTDPHRLAYEAVFGSQQSTMGWRENNEPLLNSDEEGRIECFPTNDAYDWDDLSYIEEAWLPPLAPFELVRYLSSNESTSNDESTRQVAAKVTRKAQGANQR